MAYVGGGEESARCGRWGDAFLRHGLAETQRVAIGVGHIKLADGAPCPARHLVKKLITQHSGGVPGEKRWVPGGTQLAQNPSGMNPSE